VKIQVTAEDIKQGVRTSCTKCPIALALNRATGRKWKVSGMRAENEEAGRVALPWEACRFQDRYDYDLPVNPFEFDITMERD
jgi:hypothetical protein